MMNRNNQEKLQQAIRDYRAGKAEAFNIIYEESSRYVYTCIYKVMSGNDNAQDSINDIMQDTYVEISRYIGQLENVEKFLSWAGTIATRKCFAYLDKNKKYILLNEDDTTLDNLSDSESIIPESVMQDREKQRLVREIIDTRLTEMQKLCIIAYYYNEMKQSDIARELGIPENTVKTNLSRAKARIKEGVLELEKNKDTKLYSAAPFLLLLFKEDVQAAVVPQQITKNILSSASVGSVAAKGILGKVAALSVKSKVIGIVAGITISGVVAGTAYAVSQNGWPWEDDHEIVSEEDSEDSNDSKWADGVDSLEGIGQEDETQEVELSTEETKRLRILAQFLTATNWGIDLSGQEIIPNGNNVCDFIGRVANENSEYGYDYSQYLPEMVPSEGASEIFTKESIQNYAKSVFGVELSDVNGFWFTNQDGNYVAQEAQYLSGDKCEIEKMIQTGDTYIVTGTDTFGEETVEGDIDYLETYHFTMTLVENQDSPFGYQVKGISYELAAGNEGTVEEEYTDETSENAEMTSENESQSAQNAGTSTEKIYYLEGIYKSNRGAKLDFTKNKVCISEGGNSNWYEYTLDADGTLVIDPNHEVIVAEYDADKDRVVYGSINYKRYR